VSQDVALEDAVMDGEWVPLVDWHFLSGRPWPTGSSFFQPNRTQACDGGSCGRQHQRPYISWTQYYTKSLEFSQVQMEFPKITIPAQRARVHPF
jgi:hypothetical protein